MISMIANFIGVVNSEQRAGESCDFSESYQERFVDLPKGGDINSAEEHYEPT